MAHLPDELVERLLRDEGFQPGGRPSDRGLIHATGSTPKLPAKTRGSKHKGTREALLERSPVTGGE